MPIFGFIGDLYLRWCSTWLYVVGGLILILTKSPIWIWAFLSAHMILLTFALDNSDVRLIFQYTFMVVLDFFIIIHLFLMR